MTAPPMTIEQAKAAKSALERTIASAMHQFSIDTGMKISAINVEQPYTMYGKPTQYRVEVEAML